MADQHEFETTLERRLQARASLAARPFDAAAFASAAVVARAPRRLALPWTFRGIAWGWVAVMLATLAIVGGTLLAGALLRDPYQGPWLAYASTDGLYIAHEDGTQPRRIFQSANSLRLSGWSADGALIAIVEQDPSVEQTEGDTALSERILAVDLHGRVAWSADDIGQAAWSSRGHRLAWLSASNALTVTDVDTGAVSTWLAGDADTLAANPAWSPDDTQIALTWFEGDGPATLRIVGADGSVRDLLDAPSTMAPRWSPDGRLIGVVFRDDPGCGQTADGSCKGDIVIVDAATGTQVDGVRDVESVLVVAWSPDGTRLVWDAADLATRQQNLYVGTFPLSGGEPIQLTDWPGSTWLMGWDGDARSLIAEHTVWSVDDTGPKLVELWRVPVDPAAGEPVLLRDDVIWAVLQPTP